MRQFIQPNWPAPIHVKAYTTLRTLGSMAVQEYRSQLITMLNLPNEPCWLKQVHGIEVVEAKKGIPTADAAHTQIPNTICAVLTADCLPILICNQAGTQVAAIHAGWRGLAAGIIERTVDTLGSPYELLAWLGPAIGANVFEVGSEVRKQFLAVDIQAETAFQPSPSGRWLADLYQLARQRLAAVGVTAIYGGDFCTYTDTEQFFSYRRDEQAAGRMASLIWRASD